MRTSTLSTLVFSASLASGAVATTWHGVLPRALMARQDQSFQPGVDQGQGSTCKEAFGGGSRLCADSDVCYDPTEGDLCCSEGCKFPRLLLIFPLKPQIKSLHHPFSSNSEIQLNLSPAFQIRAHPAPSASPKATVALTVSTPRPAPPTITSSSPPILARPPNPPRPPRPRPRNKSLRPPAPPLRSPSPAKPPPLHPPPPEPASPLPSTPPPPSPRQALSPLSPAQPHHSTSPAAS